MASVVVSSHPVVQHNLAALRDVRTAPADFRRAVKTLATLLAQEATADLPVVESQVTTPLGPARRACWWTWSGSCRSSARAWGWLRG